MSSSTANSKKCRAAQGLSGVLLAVWRSEVSRSPPRWARRTVSVLCLGLQVAAEISEYSPGSSAGSTPCCLPPTEAFVVKGRFFHLHTCHKRNFFSTQPLVSMVTFGAGSCKVPLLLAVAYKEEQRTLNIPLIALYHILRIS